MNSVSKPTILFFRHGETAMNAKTAGGVGELRGWDDPPPDAVGKKEAKLSAEKAKEFPISHIYSGPLKRTRAMAETISKEVNAPITVVQALGPWDYGDFTGEKETPKTLRNLKYYQDHPKLRTPGGEAYGDFLKRWGDAVGKFETYVLDNPEKVLAVVTHSRNLYPLKHILNGGKGEIPIHGGFEPGVVVKVEFEKDGKYKFTKF